jgi:hypothetical protein
MGRRFRRLWLGRFRRLWLGRFRRLWLGLWLGLWRLWNWLWQLGRLGRLSSLFIFISEIYLFLYGYQSFVQTLMKNRDTFAACELIIKC